MKRRDFIGLSSLSGFAGLGFARDWSGKTQSGILTPMFYHWILDLISTDLEILLFGESTVAPICCGRRVLLGAR